MKIITNNNETQNITVQTKFVSGPDNGINVSFPGAMDRNYAFSKNIYTVMKITFNNLLDGEKITGGVVNLASEKLLEKTTFRMVEINSVDLNNNSTLLNSIHTLVSNGNLGKIYVEESTITEIMVGENVRLIHSIDISKVIKGMNKDNNVIYLCLFNDAESTYTFLCGPEANNGASITAYVETNIGHASYKSYKEYPLSFTKGLVNINNGELTQVIDLYKGTTKKAPINLGLVIRDEIESNYLSIGNAYADFSFNIKFEAKEGYAILTDAGGYEKTYIKLDTSATNFDYADYNINNYNDHVGFTNLYYCQQDGSYFFGEFNDIYMYDRNSTRYKFSLSYLVWKLVEIRDKDNNTLTYNWDSAKVTSIVSSDGDTLMFTYTNNKINQISSSISNMYISFIYGTNTLTIKKERYNNPTNLTRLEEIEKLQLTFSSNKLINVKDLKTGDEVTYSRTNGIIDKVYSKNGTKYYCYDSFVYYDNNHTKLTDYTGKYLCYYFDIHGRVQFIIDQNGNCIDNMMEDKYEQLNRRVNHNIVQSKNYLENGDFESTTGWTFANTTQGSVDCNSDGISGKCLRVNKGTIVPVIKDYVYSVPEGNYYLCGYIKRPANDTTTQVILKGTSTVGGSSIVSNKSTLDFKLNGEWEYFETDKIEITSSLNNIEITINLISGAGDYYFDNFRLLNAKHKGSNYVQNGYFDYLTNNGPLGWTFTNFTYQETTAAQHDHPLLLGTRVLKIPFNNDLGATKRASYLIDKKGYKNEELELSVMSKCFEINQLKYRSFIKMKYDNMSPVTYYFDFKKGIEHWHAISNSIITADSYSSIEIGVEYDGEHEPLFDAFQLKEKKGVPSYMYTSNGRINQISNGSSSQQLIFDSNNQLIKSFGSDGIVSTYTYDNKNKINVIKDSLGNTITYTYDDEGKFLESISHTNSDGTITKSYVHDANGNQTSITEEGVNTNLTYDDYSRIKTSKYGEDITYNYDYYTNDLLKNVYTTPSTLVNTIVYDIWKEVSSFSNAHGTYSFTHNLDTNIYTISINGTTFATYQYEIKNVVIDNTTYTFLTNKLEQVTFNNGDVYQYVYDCEENLVEIKINNTTLAKYNYDTNGNISFESKEGQITRYIYDDDARLKKTYVNRDKIENVYQNDRIIQKKYNLGGEKRSVSYLFGDENKELTQDGFIGRLINKYQDEVIIFSNDDSSGVYGTKSKEGNLIYRKDTNNNLDYCSFETYENKVVYDLNKIHRTSNVTEWKKDFKKNQTFLSLIKFSSTISTGNLYKFYDNDTLLYTVDFTPYGIELRDANGTLLVDNSESFIDDVNMVGIKFQKEQNDITLILNDVAYSCSAPSSIGCDFNKIVISDNVLPSGLSSNSSLLTKFDMYMLIIGAHNYTSEEISQIHLVAKEKYMISKSVPKSISYTKYYNKKNLFNEYDIVDLTNNFESFNGVKPYDLKHHDNTYKTERLRSFFEKDDQLVYGCFDTINDQSLNPGDESILAYQFNDEGKGKIVVRFKLEESIINNRRTIVSFSNSSSTELMYVDAKSNGYLDVVVNGNVVETFNNNFNDNNWHTLFIDYNSNYIITVIDAEREVVIDNPPTFVGAIVYVGCSKVRETKLNGYISLLAHSDTSVQTSSGALDVAEIFETYSQPVEIINEYDSFGRKVLKRIKSANYESRDSINYKSNSYLPIYEEYNNGSIIIYSYDTSNRLTNYDNEIQNTSYTYDNLGRLTKEVDDIRGTIDYTYDNNGNIKSKVKLGKYNMSFDYDDPVYKDRLTEVTDTVNNITTTFEYDGRLGCPTKIGNNTLTWEGKNLKTYGSNTYYYNANGFRYKKVTSQGTFNYILDGDRIIRMNKDNSIIFDFTYDVNGELIGLTYNDNQYFYMRDSFGNILGIIDKIGSIIVEYVYDAYGNTLSENVGSSTDSNASIIRTYNPFRYKGYCYDVETGLFWLSSRYYSPELCRFISPDSVDYLDPSSINGLNLYAYCNNDPINKFDPSGHSALLIGMLIGFGVGFFVGGGFEIAKQAYNGGDWNWDMSSWNWGQIGLSALGGGVAGAISSISFGSGVVGYLTTFATGGIGSVLGGMISGSVTDLQSGLIAFGIGAVANVAARGITALINKGVSAGAQKALNNPIFDDMTFGDLVGSGLKNNGYAPAYNKFLNYAGNLVLKANGQWARSSMYSFANAGISSLFSGWY